MALIKSRTLETRFGFFYARPTNTVSREMSLSNSVLDAAAGGPQFLFWRFPLRKGVG